MADSNVEPTNEWTTKIPNLIYISAPRGSGKSYLMVQMLMNPELYYQKFDKIFIFSPSLDDVNDGNLFDLLNLPQSQLFGSFEEKKLKQIMKKKRRRPMEQWLVVMDDCVADKSFKNSDIAREISFNGRHLNVSMWITSQKATAGATAVRSNADQSIFFKPRSMAEIEALYQDSAVNAISKKQYIRLLNDCTREKYSFLMINYYNNTVWKKFSKLPMPEPDV